MRGPQHSAGTGGEGRPGKGGGAAPCAVLAAPRGLLWSPSRGHLSLQSDSTCPPSAAAAAEAAPAAGVPAGARALSLRLPLCFLPVPLKKRRKGGKKARNCSEMIQSFLQKCLLSSCREGTPPHRVEKISSAFSGPAWPRLSPRSPTPGRCRGETYLFLLVVVAGHPEALPPAPPHAGCEGLGEQDGASRGEGLGGKRPAAPWPWRDALGGQGSVGDSPLLPAGPHRTALCPPPACPPRGQLPSLTLKVLQRLPCQLRGIHPSWRSLRRDLSDSATGRSACAAGGPAAPGQTRNGQLSLAPETPYVAGWAAPTWTRPARGAPSATILPEGMAGKPGPQCGC